jgi:hypothetical protein
MSDFGSITEEQAATIVNARVTTADGIYVGVEEIEDTPNTFLVSFHPAVASVQKNDGSYGYFGTLDDAFKVSNAQHPVILLANDMSYALATNTSISPKNPIYVNKNGNEFTVTKVNPESADPAVAIEFEELDGGITKYTATMDSVAYVNFVKVVPDGDYGSKTVNNYVYYTSFADAVEDANNGEYTIVLTKSMTTAYVMDDTNEVLRVATDTDITANIAPAAGYELIATPVVVEGTVLAHTYDYTVSSIVASVTNGTSVEPYHDLTEALTDAVYLYGSDAYLTLYVNAPADFSFPLNRLDKFLLAPNAFSASLTGANFTAPEGYYVTVNDRTIGGVTYKEFFAQPAVASVTDNEGEHIYATFTDAVAKVLQIEGAKNYNDETKDLKNPDTVIQSGATIPLRSSLVPAPLRNSSP